MDLGNLTIGNAVDLILILTNAGKRALELDLGGPSIAAARR